MSDRSRSDNNFSRRIAREDGIVVWTVSRARSEESHVQSTVVWEIGDFVTGQGRTKFADEVIINFSSVGAISSSSVKDAVSGT